jgi:hypothetical protein
VIKLKDLLIEKKLRVFDFDDTLVKSNSKVYLMRNGKKITMTPGLYAVYKPEPGDEIDFSEFDKVIDPKKIKSMFKVFKRIHSAVGNRRLTILTARSKYKPVRQFFKDSGHGDVFVVALADANPQKKADWVEGQIKKGYDDIAFFDDSNKNVNAVKKLKRKYPHIKMKSQLVKYD